MDSYVTVTKLDEAISLLKPISIKMVKWLWGNVMMTRQIKRILHLIVLILCVSFISSPLLATTLTYHNKKKEAATDLLLDAKKKLKDLSYEPFKDHANSSFDYWGHHEVYVFYDGSVKECTNATVTFSNKKKDVRSGRFSYPEKQIKRSTMDNLPGEFLADIDGMAAFGGLTGKDILGYSIPAEEWGYFYQINNDATSPSGPDTFVLGVTDKYQPYNFEDLMFPHDGTRNEFWIDGDGPFFGQATFDNLSNSSATSSSSWGIDSITGLVTATFDGGIAPGSSSNILAFVSTFGPASETNYLSVDINAALGSGGTFVDNHLPTPVPEPSTMLLLGTGIVGLAGFSRKKFKK